MFLWCVFERMTDGVSTTRIEDHGDEVLVTVTDCKDLSRVLEPNVVFKRRGSRTDALSDTDAETFQSLYTTMDFSNQTVRVGTARVFDEDTHDLRPSPENLAYYETEIIRRDPTDAEKVPYEDSLHDAPSPVYEIWLPSMDEFRNPLESDEFHLPIGYDESERLIETFQKQIEYSRWLETKLSSKGYPTGLPPEWEPDEMYKTRDEMLEGARQQFATSKESWRTVFRVKYNELYAARREVIGETETRLESRKIPALEFVPDSNDESYCQYCGGIDFVGSLLFLEDKLGREKRVCENCAEQWNDFEADAVNKARDERARQNGGQRVFHEDYDEDEERTENE